ncbi:MAG: hypothetical protein Q3M24_05780 [Candidatus Electrothrix aestuarii]|uniref:Uncharacterized protein n=1 Tax=Candidatus Electrothrix aestuarii TaxID=3062594 RepID=A0AAU8LXG9_9BACT
MKRLLYMALAIFLVVTATAAQAEAQGRRLIGGELAGRLRAEPFETDLRVSSIYCNIGSCGGCCVCRDRYNNGEDPLKGVDAFYMEQISVSISNYPSSNGGHVNIPSVLTLTYYDLTKNQEVTVVKKMPKMSKLYNGHWNLYEDVVKSPVLVKKSKGIRAEIAPINGNTVDRDSSNNVRTINKCSCIPLE